jgi:hypothetical protein
MHEDREETRYRVKEYMMLTIPCNTEKETARIKDVVEIYTVKIINGIPLKTV